MVRDTSTTTSKGLPGMPADVRNTYEAIHRLGATGPSSARPAIFLAKQLKKSRRDLEDDLRVLEGKGIAGHQTSGKDTLWYLRR